MSEARHSEVAADCLPQFVDGDPQIAALRAAGAQRLDPLHLHYLTVLSARAQTQQGRVKTILQDKLARAVADFELRLAQAQTTVDQSVAPGNAAQTRAESLGELVRSMAPHAPVHAEAGSHETVATAPELKSVRLFRNTWSKLSADKQLNKALDQAPKNAGPINSHMLVLRSLALMRELSPDYLNRFISYADTLLCLEQAEKARHSLPKTEAAGESGKKPKARRARVR
jgi:hypothetical protein